MSASAAESTHSALTRRYIIALSLVALLSIAAYLSLRSVITAQEDSAPVVNVSGRQRMLSQRTALFALQYATVENAARRDAIGAELRAAADLMRASHRGLIEGDPIKGLPGIQSDAVHEMYFAPPLAVDAQVQDYLKRVESLLAAPAPRLSGEHPDLLYIMRVAPGRLLNSLNAMVDQYERESKASVGDLSHLEKGVLIATLLTLFLEALFIFRPMVRAVVRETEKLRRSERRLSEAKRETDDILDSVDQGFFILSRPRSKETPPVMGTQYSKRLESLLECRNFAGLSMLDALKSGAPEPHPDRRRSLTAFLQLLFRPDIREETLNSLNPFRQFEFLPKAGGERMRILQFQFQRIIRDEEIRAVMVSVQDITREIELARELEVNRADSQSQMERLFQILHVEPGPLNLFMENLDRELARMSKILARDESDLSRDALRSKLVELYRSAHTIKGEANLLQLQFIENALHDLEDKIDAPLNRGGPQAAALNGRDFIPIVAAIQSLSAQRRELHGLLERLLKFHSGWGGSLPDADAGSEIDWLPNLFPGAHDVARSLGKRIQIRADGFAPNHIPAALRPLLREVTIQLLRNAISHGIESPEEREAQGKDPEGRLQISSRRGMQRDDSERAGEGRPNREVLTVTIQDDGRGLQIDRIRQRALAQAGDEDRSAIADWPDDRVIERIFQPGFSTQEKADALSGRGVGMDLVRSRLSEYGGTIEVRSEAGRFTAFDIELPVPDGRAGFSEAMN